MSNSSSSKESLLQRHGAALGAAFTAASIIFAAGISYERINDLGARVAALSVKVEQVDSSLSGKIDRVGVTVQAISTSVAGLAGQMRIKQAEMTQ